MKSHVTLPQIRGMYNGDQARKQVLVDHGFRLPSALDNRPLKFDEFEETYQSNRFMFLQHLDLMSWNIHLKWLNKLFVQQVCLIQD